MALYKILIYGHQPLRHRAQPLEQINPQVERLIGSMGQTMYEHKGMGLAANQVGVLKRVAVIDIKQLEKQNGLEPQRDLLVFINPELVWESNEDEAFKEGCLSLPGIEAEVYRPARAMVRFRDLEFTEKEMEVSGLLARVLQHEIDHLNGKLFVDHLGFMKRALLAGQLNRLKKESKDNPIAVDDLPVELKL